MLRDSISMVLKQRSDLDTQRIHQEQLIEKFLQFPPGRIVILAEENIMMGPPARGAGHDIILPGHQRTNNITTGKLSQPSYLTEIQIRLVS